MLVKLAESNDRSKPDRSTPRQVRGSHTGSCCVITSAFLDFVGSDYSDLTNITVLFIIDVSSVQPSPCTGISLRWSFPSSWHLALPQLALV